TTKSIGFSIIRMTIELGDGSMNCGISKSRQDSSQIRTSEISVVETLNHCHTLSLLDISVYRIADPSHRLDLDQNVRAHHFGTETGADGRLFAEIFGADRVHPPIIFRVFQHDHDFVDIL